MHAIEAAKFPIGTVINVKEMGHNTDYFTKEELPHDTAYIIRYANDGTWMDEFQVNAGIGFVVKDAIYCLFTGASDCDLKYIPDCYIMAV